MGKGREAETELMPSLGGDYTELSCSKLKNGKGFFKPNFERAPSRAFQYDDSLFSLISGLSRAPISVQWTAYSIAAVIPTRTNISEQQV